MCSSAPFLTNLIFLFIGESANAFREAFPIILVHLLSFLFGWERKVIVLLGDPVACSLAFSRSKLWATIPTKCVVPLAR